MKENIKFYPKSYEFSDKLTLFFTEITNNPELQQRLYETDKIAAVADIAKELGFNISGHEILQSQAGRVLAMLDEGTDDIDNLFCGKKPKTGAQWGRGGNGYLDNAGFWLEKLKDKEPIDEEINQFLQDCDDQQLLNAKTFNEVAVLANGNGFNKLTEARLLANQANKILALNIDEAEEMANES